MFDFAPTELLILGAVAIVVIPPKDLPKAMRIAGHWMGKVRGVASQFRSGFDSMVREAELHEMEKRWAAENERIMREHPPEPALMTAPSEDGMPVMVEKPVVVPVDAQAITAEATPIPDREHPSDSESRASS